MRKTAKYILWIGLAALIIIQFIPVERTNPPLKAQPEWDSPETEAFAKRACFDCHSNQTEWPFYSYIAPISWVITHHVNHGREYFNMDDLREGDDRDEAAKEVYLGKMPIGGYTIFHSEAKFTDEEKEQFIKGLEATFGEIDREKLKKHFTNYD